MAQKYGELHKQWSGMQTPDPQTALKLIWESGIISEMQKEMITALLQNPQAPQAPQSAASAPAPSPEVAGGDAAIPTSPMGTGI